MSEPFLKKSHWRNAESLKTVETFYLKRKGFFK